MRSKRIIRSIRRLIRSVSQHSRHISDRYGITVSQLLCLQIITEREGLAAGELAAEMDLSKSTCAGILDRLELKGLVRRERSAADRRVVHVVCTESGRDMCRRTPALLQERLTRKLQILPETEQEQIASTLERIVEILNLQDEAAAPILDHPLSLSADPQPEAAGVPVL